MEKKILFGYSVFSDELSAININKRHIINTISPQCYGMAKKDKEYCVALKESDVIVVDSYYYQLFSKIIEGIDVKRYYGFEVFEYFMEEMNKENKKVFFLGSKPRVISEMISKTKMIYPNVNVAGYSPPYKSVFSEKDNEIMIKKINDFKPNILFVGLSAPKQEKWVNKQKEKINAPIMCSVGAVFEWYAGTQKKIHPLWFKLGLGWMVRIIQRPELLKRMSYVSLFFFDVFFLRLKSK
ncbi:WecB/TagA/CpsF family glycosyltransferase [Prosthecochloris sp. SCSIO W1103]|uniref:WecB/TagA/CpsF family glycosyltransferase n=1 Tax=Prosthecochloris sp. SCSIO W1103 TaxID=2992244 RepID=UPI00223E574C|nr:WecB/TagA/CpsF family glycosyltransferase [Prosthecochloris sp. SCSIO W1103]UZJ38149.1 WecB/TagA/CpsF family glycosyltransferase [Prosthecochloris sp. SCSIO W1103]